MRYNKALSKYAKENTYGAICGVWTNGRITLCQNDLTKGWPDFWMGADVVTSVLPWRDGYAVFTRNSIAEGTYYANYLFAVGRMIRRIGKPAFLATSKERFVARALKPDRIQDGVRFSEYGSDVCRICSWGPQNILFSSTDDMREFACREYETVLDFSCGYAEALRGGAKRLFLGDVDYDILCEIIEREGLECLRK